MTSWKQLLQIATDETETPELRLQRITDILREATKPVVFLTIKYMPEDSDNWRNATMMHKNVETVTVDTILTITHNLPPNTKVRVWRQDRRIGDDLVLEGNSTHTYWNRTNLDGPPY